MKLKLMCLGTFMVLSILLVSGCFEDNSDTQEVVQNKTLYVGGNGTGNYSNIQDAVDNASDGDTVFVYDGQYEPFLYNPLTDNRSIEIIGETYIDIYEIMYNETVELEGNLLHYEWSKTSDSYCAGGSDYYTLKEEDETEVILEYSEGSYDYVNKTVVISGIYKVKTTIPGKGLQAPAIGVVSCIIFEVMDIGLYDSDGVITPTTITGIIRIPIEYQWSPVVGGCYSPSALVEYANKTYYLNGTCDQFEAFGMNNSITNMSLISEEVIITGEIERKEIDILVSKMPTQTVKGTCLVMNVETIELA